MRRLRVDTYTVHSVDYSELERFIQEVYGKTYEIVPGEEWSNGMNKEINVSCKKPHNKYDQKSLDKWKETGEGEFLIYVLMQDMVNNDHIPEGKYLIDVFW